MKRFPRVMPWRKGQKRRPKTFGRDGKSGWGTGNHAQRLRGARSSARAKRKRRRLVALLRLESRGIWLGGGR